MLALLETPTETTMPYPKKGRGASLLMLVLAST